MLVSRIKTGSTMRNSCRRSLACLGVLASLGACAGPQQVAQQPASPAPTLAGISAPPSQVTPVPGFLPQPQLLRPGGPGEPTLIYINPAVDRSLFTSVMLDPVQLWIAPGAPMAAKERQAAANLFYSELLSALQQNCRVVQWPPRLNTLRMQFNVVDVSLPNPAPAATGQYVPYSRAAYDTQSMPFDRSVGEFAVSATLEGYGKDARTGILVFQGVDKRSPAMVPAADAVRGWEDVHNIFANWANYIVAKLKRDQICP
jgi:Protein of unknown function (DUF3313)